MNISTDGFARLHLSFMGLSNIQIGQWTDHSIENGTQNKIWIKYHEITTLQIFGRITESPFYYAYWHHSDRKCNHVGEISSLAVRQIVIRKLPPQVWSQISPVRLHFPISNFLLLAFSLCTRIARFVGPTWGPPGSCRPQMGPVLVPWTLLSGYRLHAHGTQTHPTQRASEASIADRN